MALIRIGDGVVGGGNDETPLVFNLESTQLGDHFYIHGTDGKLYLSYTNGKFHLARADRTLINKILASSTPLNNKVQIFKDQNINIQTNNDIYPRYLYIDVDEQSIGKSYAWLWIIVVTMIIILFLVICLFIKFANSPSTETSSQLSPLQFINS